MTDPADVVAARVDPDPPSDRPEPHDRLFTDLDDEMGEHLFALWQHGVVRATWDEEDEETLWQLTEFGVALFEADLAHLYIRACESDVNLDDPAPALSVTEGV